MRRLLVVFLLLAVPGAGGCGAYYFWLSPEAKQRRLVLESLEEFNQAVEAQDRTRIINILASHLMAEAGVELSMIYDPVGSSTRAPGISSRLNRAGFLEYVDAQMQRFRRFGGKFSLTSFTPAAEGMPARAEFSGDPWAEGSSPLMDGAMQMNYGASVPCRAELMFITQQGGRVVPAIAKLQCEIYVRMRPAMDPENLEQLRQKFHDMRNPQVTP